MKIQRQNSHKQFYQQSHDCNSDRIHRHQPHHHRQALTEPTVSKPIKGKHVKQRTRWQTQSQKTPIQTSTLSLLREKRNSSTSRRTSGSKPKRTKRTPWNGFGGEALPNIVGSNGKSSYGGLWPNETAIATACDDCEQRRRKREIEIEKVSCLQRKWRKRGFL